MVDILKNQSIMQKTLLGWLGFITSSIIVIIIDSKYKDSIMGDILSFVIIIMLITSSTLIWKACDHIKPTALRIFVLGMQYSALMIASYSLIVYYIADTVVKK